MAGDAACAARSAGLPAPSPARGSTPRTPVGMAPGTSALTTIPLSTVTRKCRRARSAVVRLHVPVPVRDRNRCHRAALETPGQGVFLNPQGCPQNFFVTPRKRAQCTRKPQRSPQVHPQLLPSAPRTRGAFVESSSTERAENAGRSASHVDVAGWSGLNTSRDVHRHLPVPGRHHHHSVVHAAHPTCTTSRPPGRLLHFSGAVP